MRAFLPCTSKICLLLMRLPWLVCTICCPFLTIFWFPFPLWLALFGAGPCLMVGFAFSSAHPSSYYYLLLYHSIIPTAKLFCFKLGGPLWACRLFFPQWPSKAIGSYVTLLASSHVPFVFPWASLAIFLTLHYHRLLLNSLDFLGPITLFHIFGVHELAINPLLYLLSLLWACHDPFSLFHIIYCPWFAFSLFPGSFKPIYLLKTHLFISWACDPLFLPLGLDGFSIRLPTPFCPCCWPSSSYLGFQNGPQQSSSVLSHYNY